jgi:diguanylate cyclase (GGDEF)-like protein
MHVRNLDSGRAALLVPYGAVATTAWLLIAVGGGQLRAGALSVAGALQLLVALMLSVAPRWCDRRVPVLATMAAFDVSVVLVRDGVGPQPAFASLVLMPILCASLRGRRGELAAAIAGSIAVLLGPVILAGGPRYPAAEWRSYGLLVVTGAVLGVTVTSLVQRLRAGERRQRELAEAQRQLQLTVERQRDHANDLLASQAALRTLATLVAAGAPPAEVFRHAAGEIGELFDGRLATVVRYDFGLGVGEVVGGWSQGAEDPSGRIFDLRGGSATAHVSRTGAPVRIDCHRQGGSGRLVGPLRAAGEVRVGSEVGVPIVVGRKLWGSVGVAFDPDARLRVDTEARLVTFAELVALAISNAAAWAALREQATTDPVTGLANHRAFHERLRTEVRRAARHGRALSIAVFDLDHFKSVNDTYGHQTGDEVLAAVARRLAGVARAGELVARTGGEEFAWLMPETPEEGAHVAAERARRAIESRPFEGVGRLTLSAGVSSNEHGSTAEELFSAADKALYLAKERGRNTTVSHVVSSLATG